MINRAGLISCNSPASQLPGTKVPENIFRSCRGHYAGQAGLIPSKRRGTENPRKIYPGLPGALAPRSSAVRPLAVNYFTGSPCSGAD
jgi:hypothetical protein